ncbi:hypothetical protein SAMN05421858_5104 [Haladaptatus litoreus]|uniref:Uncharacterized protein n=1 Tax=Haladaptatus litoreus TaxID=553468 RepID=A0A1N7FIT1_9EURY|nr:hypothetical protein [Haladaptatus litoreus]SIS00200.1 hypothetical protein SAMN05421858_5104 [Haladaptatus litoreus]
MVRDRRPSEIELLEDLIDEDTTDPQKEAIRVIDENPEMAFSKMPEVGAKEYGTKTYTDSHYSDVYYKFFGPVDDRMGRSFREIKNRYGTLKNYYENRYDLDDIVEQNSEGEKTEQLSLDASALLSGERTELSDKEYDLLKMGIKIGFEQGVERGVELERDRARKNRN